MANKDYKELEWLGADAKEQRHAGWRSCLLCFGDYLDRYSAQVSDDHPPFAYNEEALRGFLGAAVFASGRENVAIEEYTSVGFNDEKGTAQPGVKYPDLFAKLGSHTYRVEAKRRWMTSWGNGIEDRFASGRTHEGTRLNVRIG
jgi:hypothetical protein